MTTGENVLSFLIPEGGWAITGNDFEGIQFVECEPITKKQFEDGFSQYETWKINQAEVKAAARQAVLDKLGLTADEVAALGL